MACSRRRIAHFLEKKSSGKPYLAAPEDKQHYSCSAIPRSHELESEIALSAKPMELENTSPTCGRKKDSVSLENQKQAQASEPDLDLNTLSEVYSDDVSSILVNNICSNCKDLSKLSEVYSDDVSSVLVNNICSNCKDLSKQAVFKLSLAIVVFTAREKIWIFTGLHVPLWPKGQLQNCKKP